jgi:hypothetical protein
VNHSRFTRFTQISRQFLLAGGAALLLATQAWADEKFDSLTVGSTTYSNVTVLNKTRYDVFITHDWGLANVKVQDLDYNAQVKLGYQAPKEEAGKSIFNAPKEILSGLDPVHSDLQQFEQQLPPEVLTLVEQVAEMPEWMPRAIVGTITFVYLTFCFLCRQICVKTGQEPSLLIWMPILKQFPMLRAAGMSAWWFLLNFVGLWGIRSLVWCFKIAVARGKHWSVGLLLVLPVTNIFAFLYLAFSSGLGDAPPPVHKAGNSKVITLQGGEQRQAA